MNPSDNFETFIPVYDGLPDTYEEAREYLVEQLRQVADGVNSRDYGVYADVEVINGQEFGVGTEELKPVFRKVIDLGGLPDFGVTDPKQVAHGITFSENARITRFYGTATDPATSNLTSAIPLPYVQMSAGAHIGLEIDGTNIELYGNGAADYSAYTTAYAVVEWTDQA